MEWMEGEDRMSEEAGDEIEGGGELAPPDWRVRAGPRKTPAHEGEGTTRSNARADQRQVHTLHDGQRTHPPPRHQTEDRGSIEKAYNCDEPLLNEHELCGGRSNNIIRISNMYCSERRQASEHHEQCRVEEMCRRTICK